MIRRALGIRACGDAVTTARCGCALLAVLLLVGALPLGCASTAPKADPVYFPPPPAVPHVVHLKSFNSLADIAPRRGSWTELFRGRSAGPYVATPAGVAYADGHLYICDTGLNVVHDWDLAAGKGSRIGGRGDVVLAKPVAVAVDEGGTIYVADTGRAEVVSFDSAGQARLRFRRSEEGEYQPVAVAVVAGKLFVADVAAHQIGAFSMADGTYLEAIGGVGSEPGRFYFPIGLAGDDDGNLFVSDMLNGRIQVLGRDHGFVRAVGRPGNRYGDLGAPKHLDVGPDGVVFVADCSFGYVHLFDRNGRLLMLFGGPGNDLGGTPLPTGVAVARELPARLVALVPPGFKADYFVFVSNTVGEKRIGLFAVGLPHQPVAQKS